MAASVSRSVFRPSRPVLVHGAEAGNGFWRSSSLLISFVVVLLAALLIATPPLALLTSRSEVPSAPVAPAPAPAQHLSLTVSQFA